MHRLRAFESILVPTDFSRGARRALQRAVRVPLAGHGQIRLVHVLPAERAPRTPKTSRSEARRSLERVAAKLANAARSTRRAGPAIATEVLQGDPAVEIIRSARGIGAELVVLGRKGVGSRFGKVLGTTAARVVHMGETPALIVGSRPVNPYRRPLIGLELDPSARRIIDLVRRIVGSDRVTLRAVHAYHVPFEGFVATSLGSGAQLHHRQVREQAAAELQRVLAALHLPGVQLKAALRRGDPRLVIPLEAASCDADLIAVGTHGRSGIAHFLLGSVAEAIVTNSSHDVLIARPVRFTFEAP